MNEDHHDNPLAGSADGLKELPEQEFAIRFRERLRVMSNPDPAAIANDVAALRDLCSLLDTETEDHLATLTVINQRTFSGCWPTVSA